MKDLQVLLNNTNNRIQHYSFVSTQLTSASYCYVSSPIQLNINHLFTQLNVQTFLFLTIRFNVSHLFANCLNVKEFYRTLSGVTTLGQSGTAAMAMKEYAIFS